MKVFLCQSYGGPEGSLIFPMGLAYIASMLRDRELFCWDPNVSPNNYIDEFRNLLEKFEPDVVGISFRNIDDILTWGLRNNRVRSYYPPFVSIVRTVKEVLPSCKLVVGGSGFSIFPEEIMRRNPEIDFGVFSEGEYAFSNLLNNLEHPGRVKNLLIRDDERIIFTGRRDYVDFASLPSPSRELFDVSKYKDRYISIGVESKRGCRFGCIYCVYRHFMGTHYRLRPPRDVVDEIEMLVDEYGIESFYFVDPIFNFPPEHGHEICREIIRRKLDVAWEGCFRPDYLNKSYMMEAVEAGCQLFDFSPDGASNDAMRILGKNLDVGSLDKSIKWTGEIEDAKVAYQFLYDLQDFNKEHIRGLLHFFPKILRECKGKLRYLNLSKMRIYPNTPLYKIALKERKISEKTDLIFPVYYESRFLKKTRDFLPLMFKALHLLLHKRALGLKVFIGQ